MNAATLRADCARCAALCCVALSFDRSPLFAFDKAAGQPCLHLNSCGRCAIHADRERRGFAGCVSYDCLGAGQRVTQEVFAGRNWRDEPSILVPMLRAFAIMSRVHELLLLLGEAGKLALAPDERGRLAALEAALQPGQAWSARSLEILPLEALTDQVAAFLATLRSHVTTLRKDIHSRDSQY